jgi:hypothetical protein
VLALFSAFVAANPKVLEQRLSQVEKHNYALCLHPEVVGKATDLPEIVRKCYGELGHIHCDTSLHLYFSPADAKVVIEKGWAQRHRCARRQVWGAENMFGIGITFLIVYAPRNAAELEVLATLIRVSAAFISGGRDIARP